MLSAINIAFIVDLVSIAVGLGVTLCVGDVLELTFFVFVADEAKKQRGQLRNTWDNIFDKICKIRIDDITLITCVVTTVILPFDAVCF